MAGLKLLAFDLGAESGRAVLGRLDGRRLALTEVHRFANEPVLLPDGLHWDALRLFHEIQNGLARAARDHGPAFDGIAVDTWGVDFALLGAGGLLLGEPYHYRDHRTDGILDEAFRVVPREEIYAATGIQFLPFNTLYQLWVMQRAESPLLGLAGELLFMPGLFTFLLSGEKANDHTIVTTSQCYDGRKNEWALELTDRFDLPRRLFGPVTPPGTVVGRLRPALSGRTGAAGAVIAAAGHDTASAVAAVPAAGSDFLYISCGTWSLAGAETPAPVVNDRTLAAGLTNEGGVGGTIRLLKNIMGLWLVQECRRSWARGGRDHGYPALTAMAAGAPAFRTLIDPDDASFLNPADMPRAMAEYARRTGQPVPGDEGEFVRAALEGLALKFRWTLGVLEEVLGRRLGTIHMVGGGIQNELLCQFTADATGRPVVAGPVEAAAAGNVLVQAMAVGAVADLGELRSIVRASFDLKTYEPRDRQAWDDAYDRLKRLMRGSGQGSG